MDRQNTAVIVCSDVHLCHIHWYGCASADRLEYMVDQLRAHRTQRPYEKILFLGDYSLDHWKWESGGSFLNDGVSNADNFAKQFAARLDVPFYMFPGNHEQYGNDTWRAITGGERRGCFTVGGYLFICCDNFAADLDPDVHSDGTYTACDLDFVRACLKQHPAMPAILCAHYFDLSHEPPAFFEFIKEERRITLLMAGHTHSLEVIPLGERADNVCMYLDGHFSYAGGGQPFAETMWGFSELVLTETGVEITYIEPANTVTIDGQELHHPHRERTQGFFTRRDI